jgi:hypothetical protein
LIFQGCAWVVCALYCKFSFAVKEKGKKTMCIFGFIGVYIACTLLVMDRLLDSCMIVALGRSTSSTHVALPADPRSGAKLIGSCV